MTLGEQLRAARAAKRMTLRALAQAMGVSAPFLSDVEHDRRPLSPERLKQAADVLEIDVALLEAASGYTRDLGEWIAKNVDLVKLLREMRSRDEPVVIGGPTCPCCGRDRER